MIPGRAGRRRRTERSTSRLGSPRNHQRKMDMAKKAPEPVEEPDDLADEEIDDLDEEMDEDLGLDGEDDDDDDAGAGADEDEDEEPPAKRPGKGDEDGDEDEELADDEDVEASLDIILKERLVVEEPEDDEEAPEPEDRSADGVERVLPKQPGEFVCRSCFLVKHGNQLADKKKMLCRDCV